MKLVALAKRERDRRGGLLGARYQTPCEMWCSRKTRFAERLDDPYSA